MNRSPGILVGNPSHPNFEDRVTADAEIPDIRRASELKDQKVVFQQEYHALKE